MSKPRLPTQTLDHAKRLRKGMTDAERRLWQYLRAGRLEGMKFRRQHPLPPYIVDFCCVEAGLVVELDGSQHSPAADAARTGSVKREEAEEARRSEPHRSVAANCRRAIAQTDSR